MSKHNRETSSRGEVADAVTERQREYEKLDEALTEHADDTEILREFDEILNRDITDDALEVVNQTIDEAKQISSTEFSEDADKLAEVHDEGREQEEELREQYESAQEDLEKTDQAREKLDSSAVIAEMRRVLEAMQRDLEFLAEQERLAKDAREASDQTLQQEQQRMGRGK